MRDDRHPISPNRLRLNYVDFAAVGLDRRSKALSHTVARLSTGKLR
jgi:hypothetical protein